MQAEQIWDGIILSDGRIGLSKYTLVKCAVGGYTMGLRTLGGYYS